MMQGLDALAAASDAATQAEHTGQQRLQSHDHNGTGAQQNSVNGIQMSRLHQHQGQPSPAPANRQTTPVLLQTDATPSHPAYTPVQTQWGQAIQMFGAPSATATSAAAAILQAAMAQNAGQGKPGAVDAFNAMQHLAHYQYMQSKAAAQFAQMSGSPNYVDQNNTLTFAGHQAAAQQAATQQQEVVLLAAPVPSAMSAHPSHSQQPQYHNMAMAAFSNLQQVIPGPSHAPSSSKPSPTGSMLPPPPPSQVSAVPTLSSSQQITIAPNKPVPVKPMQAVIARRPVMNNSVHCGNTSGSDDEMSCSGGNHGDKKNLKRAANRRSAQLSRKRKKQFIEELKEENDELRRKEAILRSIPDLIVVFDSAGKLWFVSHSVNRFLDFSPSELQGSSFWERLCPESVRLLKAAFMDALAARKSDMDTAPLGSGVWELRLVDKDGTHKVITLNGVVHFSGDTPECVCSIRPRDEAPQVGSAAVLPVAALSGSTAVSVSETSHAAASVSASSESNEPRRRSNNFLTNIQPGQSVMNNSFVDDSSVRMVQGKTSANDAAPDAGRQAIRISDADSGSVVSESGSDE